MKKYARPLSLVLALALCAALVLTGCGQKSAETTDYDR